MKIQYLYGQLEYTTTASSDLKKHKKGKHRKIKYYCDQCDCIATLRSSLTTHKKSQHEGKFLCVQCKYVKTIVRIKRVRVMIEKLHCSKYLKHLNSTEPDQFRVSGIVETDNKIKIVKIVDIQSTIDHEYENKNNDIISEDCDLISKLMHQKSIHRGKRYLCDLCDYVTNLQSNLKRHKKFKHEGFRYPCDKCDHVAKHQWSLNLHKKSKHEGIIYPCDKCEFVSKHQSQLNVRKKSKHEGVRYPCEQCDHVATRQWSLDIHKKSKHEASRYSCYHWDYVAAQQGHLKIHIESKHEGQFCDKTKIKGKHVKVLIEKIDITKYLKHLNSSELDQLDQIQIFDPEEVGTNVKSEDIRATIDHEYESETKDSKLNEYLESDDCDMISKIEIEEDLLITTESSDLTEFIEQCQKEDISNEIRPESEFIGPDEENMNPVTIEDFFPQWNSHYFDKH